MTIAGTSLLAGGPRTRGLCRSSFVVWYLCVAALGCEGVTERASGEVDGGVAGCAADELSLPEGECRPVGLPREMPCPPGEIWLPEGRCQPAGLPPGACGAGFVPLASGGCEAVVPAETCPEGTMAVPGERACRAVAPCGQGPYGEIPLDATTEHVDQAHSGNASDGSRENPWKTIQAGVDAAAPGAVVAVAAGRYQENVRIAGKPVRLRGRCPALVEVVGTEQAIAAIRIEQAAASGATVQDIAITGPRRGLIIERAPSVSLERVWIHDAANGGVELRGAADGALRNSLIEHNQKGGILLQGASATLEASVVRGSRPDASRQYGQGVVIGRSASTNAAGALIVRGSLIEQNHEVGVAAVGSSVTVEASVVRDTLPSSSGIGGMGIFIQPRSETGDRAELALRGSVVERNRGVGVLIDGSTARIEASVVRATLPSLAGQVARGVSVQSDRSTQEPGELAILASVIEGNHENGVTVQGSTATIERSVVRGAVWDERSSLGRGVSVEVDATGRPGELVLRASVVEDNPDVGVLIIGSTAKIEASVIERNQGAGAYSQGAMMTIESSVVRGTMASSRLGAAIAVGVQESLDTQAPGELALRSSLLEQNQGIGVFVAASSATVEASVIRGNLPNAVGRAGRSVNVQDQGQLTLRTSLIEEGHEAGVLVIGSRATIEGTRVRDIQPEPASGGLGDGLTLTDQQELATVEVTESEFLRNARAGLMFANSAGRVSRVTARDNRYGLVQTGERMPELGEGNVFSGNGAEDLYFVGENLPVPDKASRLP